MLNNTLHEKSQYQVQGIFWDPMYQDFDIGDFTVSAYTKKQAEYKAKQHWMWQFAKKPPSITKIKQIDGMVWSDELDQWVTQEEFDRDSYFKEKDQIEQLIDDHINSDINR